MAAGLVLGMVCEKIKGNLWQQPYILLGKKESEHSDRNEFRKSQQTTTWKEDSEKKEGPREWAGRRRDQKSNESGWP